jgi:hypothetical protein
VRQRCAHMKSPLQCVAVSFRTVARPQESETSGARSTHSFVTADSLRLVRCDRQIIEMSNAQHEQKKATNLDWPLRGGALADHQRRHRRILDPPRER